MSVRIAQIGTKHGHARGKLLALLNHADVDFVGLWEPDEDQRQRLIAGDDLYRSVTWLESEAALLEDPSIVAVASEGSNMESLDQTEALVNAGKHVWYDKPAGENWGQWQRVVAQADQSNLLIQMGYMFRYHDGFRQIAEWSRSGFLGNIYSIRAHMSTNISVPQRKSIGHHHGGIFFDLGGHMLDQLVWILGRPLSVTGYMHNHSGIVPACADNTVAVLECEGAIAQVDIAAMESRPMARRYEVYGDRGSAILLEPFEPGKRIRLCLDKARDGFKAGEQFVPTIARSRQALYNLELDAFLATITDNAEPIRPPAHDTLVQETLLRATGVLQDHG